MADVPVRHEKSFIPFPASHFNNGCGNGWLCNSGRQPAPIMIFSTSMMPDKPPEKEMTFIDHLEELRKRILKALVAVGIFAVAAYFISDRLIDIITAPLRDVGVYF